MPSAFTLTRKLRHSSSYNKNVTPSSTGLFSRVYRDRFRSLSLLSLQRFPTHPSALLAGTTTQPTRELLDCSLARLSEHEREMMQLHDRSLFTDPTCSQSGVRDFSELAPPKLPFIYHEWHLPQRPRGRTRQRDRRC